MLKIKYFQKSARNKKRKNRGQPSFNKVMQRGSSRLNASIFHISSSNLFTKSSSFDALSKTFPIIETSARKSLIVLGTKVGLKSKLSSGGTEPISDLSPEHSYYLLSLYKFYQNEVNRKYKERPCGSVYIF